MKSLKILIVDDEESHRFIIAELLKEKGFNNLTFAENGKHALKKINKNKPDIVITDTKMPGIDGFETCRRIKAQHSDIPVIITTCQKQHVNFVRAKQVGADAYSMKTHSCEELLWNVIKIANKELEVSAA